MDRLINTGGEKVDPAEVQEALRQLEGIEEAKVVGEPDEQWGEVVVAYVRSSSSAISLSEQAIQHRLKWKLSPYKIPKSIRILE